MAFTYQKLAETISLQASATDIIVNNVGETRYLRTILIHNVNTTTETVVLYLVPDSGGSKGTASDTGNRIYTEALTGGTTRILEFVPPGLMLTDQNDSLQGKTTTNSKALVYVYGGME